MRISNILYVTGTVIITHAATLGVGAVYHKEIKDFVRDVVTTIAGKIERHTESLQEEDGVPKSKVIGIVINHKHRTVVKIEKDEWKDKISAKNFMIDSEGNLMIPLGEAIYDMQNHMIGMTTDQGIIPTLPSD